MRRVLVVAALLLLLAGGGLVLLGTPDDRAGAGASSPGTTSGWGSRGLAATQDAVPAARTSSPATGAESASPEWLVRGRVADRLDAPVPGAEVVLRVGDAETTGRSGPDGRFTLATRAPPTDARFGCVRAVRGRDAGVLTLQVHLVRAETDVGTVVVGPTSHLVVRVLADGGAVSGARVFAAVTLEDAPQLFHSPQEGPWAGWSHVATTDASGVARFDALPLGHARLLALAEGPRRAEGRVRVASSGGVALLDLRPARDVEVTVVDAAAGTPIPDVTVAVDRAARDSGQFPGDPLDDPVHASATDREGRTVLSGLPRDETLFLHVQADGWEWPRRGSGTARLDAGATSMRIAVPAGRRRTWPVEAGEGPLPADGTRVRFRAEEGGNWGWSGDLGFPDVEGRVEGATLVVNARLVAHQAGVAVLPDGRVSAVEVPWSDTRPPKPVRFSPARSLVVSVREEGGAPAIGVGVRLKAGGRWLGYAQATDGTGTARFEDLPYDEMDVHLEPNAALVEPTRWCVFQVPSTRANLRAGTSRVDLVVPARREAHVLVTLDGTPGLPERFRLQVKDHPDGLDGAVPPDAAFDETRGEIRFRVTPPAPEHALAVLLFAPGTTQGFGTLREESPGGPFVLSVDLARAATVEVEVRLPADGRSSVGLEILGNGRWDDVGANVDPVDRDAPNRVFRRLPPGTYRAFDGGSGVVGPTFEARAGPAPTRTVLDLTRVVPQRVAPSLPPDADRLLTRLFLEGDGLTPSGGHDGKDGDPPGIRAVGLYEETFSVRLPGDRPVTLRLDHPFLVPARDGGSVTLVAPRDGLTLRLDGASYATLTPQGVRGDGEDLWQAGVWVVGEDGRPARAETRRVSDRLQFGGYPSGVRDVWVDHPRHAPTRVASADLRRAGADLGRVALVPGATLRVEARVPDSAAPPTIWLVARSEAPYAHHRGGLFRSPREASVPGLGAGTYLVEVRRGDEATPRETKRIESDGRGEIVVDVDLR